MLPAPEAGDFVELILIYVLGYINCFSRDGLDCPKLTRTNCNTVLLCFILYCVSCWILSAFFTDPSQSAIPLPPSYFPVLPLSSLAVLLTGILRVIIT